MSWERLSASKVHSGMGFKYLSAFNLAMLGKQGWKFLTEPDSLVSCIFKVWYFPSQLKLAIILVMCGIVLCAPDLSFAMVLVGVLEWFVYFDFE